MEEKENQDIIEQKQKYLRDEILSKNYDADEFSEFISHYKENGLDLSNWTFDELKDAVEKFKNKNKGEDDEKSIEKEVENIKNSYIINRIEDLVSKPDNNNNLENKNNNNDNINNNNNGIEFDIIDYVDDKNTNERNKIRIMNSSIRIDELDLENEGINNIVNIQKFTDNPNEGNQNISKDNRFNIIENNNKNNGETMELIQNNNINENNNNIIQNTNEKKSICDDFEILDNPYTNNNNNCNNNSNNNVNNINNNNANNINNNNVNNIYNNDNNIYDNNVNNIYNNNANNIYNNNANNINQNITDMMQLKLKCVKQPENSLTNNNNLEVNLEM